MASLLYRIPALQLYSSPHARSRLDLPQHRRKDLETLQADDGRIETLAIELSLKGEKWLLLSMYKQPLVKSKSFVEALEWLFSKSSKNLILFGDLM